MSGAVNEPLDILFIATPSGQELCPRWVRFGRVRHADGRQVHRIGLQPQVAARPTLAEIRAGRDEELDEAVEYMLHGPH